MSCKESKCACINNRLSETIAKWWGVLLRLGGLGHVTPKNGSSSVYTSTKFGPETHRTYLLYLLLKTILLVDIISCLFKCIRDDTDTDSYSGAYRCSNSFAGRGGGFGGGGGADKQLDGDGDDWELDGQFIVGDGLLTSRCTAKVRGS